MYHEDTNMDEMFLSCQPTNVFYSFNMFLLSLLIADVLLLMLNEILSTTYPLHIQMKHVITDRIMHSKWMGTDADLLSRVATNSLSVLP